MTLTNFFINPIQTEIITGKDTALAKILFSVSGRVHECWNHHYSNPGASGHTVHCLGHDSISGPAIGPFFSMLYLQDVFFHFGESRAMKRRIFFSFSKFWKGVFVKKKIKAVLRETEFKTKFPNFENEKKNSAVYVRTWTVNVNTFSTTLKDEISEGW